MKDGITTVSVYVNGKLGKFIFKCDFIPLSSLFLAQKTVNGVKKI